MVAGTYHFKGKVAMVTGASGGIGRVIAMHMLKAGASVACLDRPGRPGPGALVSETGDELERRMIVHSDIRSEGQVRRAVQAVLRRFGRIDFLVNSAAVRGPTTPVTRLTKRAWQEVVDTNLTGAFLFARECLKHMVGRRQGRIINISSVAGRMAYPWRAAYAASKWGLIGLTLTLAQEAGRANVLVNGVCPGPVEGPAMEKVLARRAKALALPNDEMRRRFLDSSALGRMVTAADVSNVVLFLCSEAARNITGQVIEVSAGFGLWLV
jgi:NAD(P)-dependent dehydrogenase (short-subunit alcohol dehydrogenase family)